MGSLNSYDQSTKDFIVAEYNSGKTISALARAYGISDPTITKWLRTAGVEIRKTNGRELKLDVDAVNLLYDSGKSSYDIATELGCNPESVRRLIRKPRPAPITHRFHKEEDLRTFQCSVGRSSIS